MSVKRRNSSGEVVVRTIPVNIIHISKYVDLIIKKSLQILGRGRVEELGQTGKCRGGALQDTRGDVVFVVVKCCCGDDLYVDGVEIGDKTRVGELAELLGEVRLTY